MFIVDITCSVYVPLFFSKKKMMTVLQKTISLPSFPRGSHLITDLVVKGFPEIRTVKVGLLNLLLQHTSASITINENFCSDVRTDLNHWMDTTVPESFHWDHSDEGPDDMPAHVKSSLMGVSINIPITDGNLNLGTWQGIYLNEHRNHGGSRRLVLTLTGKTE